MEKHIVIAIDGPAGAGKSTAASGLAQNLDIHCLDTGALFRAFALRALRKGVDFTDFEAVEKAVQDAALDIDISGGIQKTILDGEDVSDSIRTAEIAKGASDIGAIPVVRTILTEKVRDIASRISVVVDGRDVGTAMLPEADFKFYLTATPEERAHRRYMEVLKRGEGTPYAQVLKDIRQRDYNDSHRAIAPLRQAEDAIVIDSTDLDVKGVLREMLRIIREGK